MQQVYGHKRRVQDVFLVLLLFFFFCHFLFNRRPTIFVSAYPLGYFLFIQKINKNMDPIFEHPVFDSARERTKRFIRQLEKLQEAFENSLYFCFKCGSNNLFATAKQVKSADEGTSVFSECRDCYNKGRDG